MKCFTKFAVAMLTIILLSSTVTGCGLSEKQSTTTSKDSTKEKMQVAFIYNAQIGDYGWAYSHDVARKEIEKKLDYVKTVALENVAPGAKAERTMRELASRGFEVIVAPSSDYEADVLKVAKDLPNVKFLICGGTVSQKPNVESFWPKHYQMWYIMGKLAGYMTKTDVLGIVGAIVHPLDLQTQNAFTLGALSVNPKVKVRCLYINTYYDPAAEKDAAKSLINVGADVIAQSTNTPSHVQAAEEEGVYALSMWADMHKFGPKAFLSGDNFDWSQYYIPTIEEIHQGKWTPKMATFDITSGILRMADFGESVPQDVKDKIKAELDKVVKGGVDPDNFWQGPIYDNKDNLVVPKGEKLTEEQLLNMNWWVKGVVTSKK